MARREANYGGYGFIDSGDKAGGVWTPRERRVVATRRQAAELEAAAIAESEMAAAIAEIVEDGTLSAEEKRYRLSLLRAGGYSEAEFKMLQDARDSS